MVALAVGVFATPALAKPKPNEACRTVASITESALFSLNDPGPAADYTRAAQLFRKMTGQKAAILTEAHKIGRRMAKATTLLGKNTALFRADNFCKY